MNIRRVLAVGIREVWLVDPAAETIEIHTERGSRKLRADEKATSGVVAGVAVVPGILFAE